MTAAEGAARTLGLADELLAILECASRLDYAVAAVEWLRDETLRSVAGPAKRSNPDGDELGRLVDELRMSCVGEQPETSLAAIVYAELELYSRTRSFRRRR